MINDLILYHPTQTSTHLGLIPEMTAKSHGAIALVQLKSKLEEMGVPREHSDIVSKSIVMAVSLLALLVVYSILKMICRVLCCCGKSRRKIQKDDEADANSDSNDAASTEPVNNNNSGSKGKKPKKNRS